MALVWKELFALHDCFDMALGYVSGERVYFG